MPSKTSTWRQALAVLAVVVPICWAWPGRTAAVGGVDFPARIQRDGVPLVLVGVGLREATLLRVDVYALGVYAPTRQCDGAALLAGDEPGLLRLDFLRTVSAARLRDELADSFARRLPADAAPDLAGRVQAFLALLSADAHAGTRVELAYRPGHGTALSVDGVPRGAVPGPDFRRLLWSLWFGASPCCPEVLEGVRATCSGAGDA